MIRRQANEASARGHPNDGQAERLRRVEVHARAEEDPEATAKHLDLGYFASTNCCVQLPPSSIL